MIVTSAARLIIIFATPDKTRKTGVSASIDTTLREVSHDGEEDGTMHCSCRVFGRMPGRLSV
jgi:hypothetical protein